MNQIVREPKYAYWNVPATSLTITYSLSVFHEIDFQVSEGFRRIPHGGIEIGGLLFGKAEANEIRIEAFRPIECEHALGPSFVLSERDLAALREQLANAKSDPELAGFEAVGWLISHTRSPLRMNDREAGLFDELFPETGRITVLAKPERFQPTRFGFLVRNGDATVLRDATEQAIILPLSGRPTRSGNGPLPSIPAPHERSAPGRAPAPAPTEAIPQAIRRQAQPTAELTTDTVAQIPPPVSLPPPDPPPAVVQAQTLAPIETPETEQVATAPPTANLDPLPSPLKQELFRSLPDTLPSIEELRRRRSDHFEITDIRLPPEPSVDKVQQPKRPWSFRIALVLVLAAVLGCAAGYWAYLQLPSATIPLEMQTQSSSVLVSWPPDQTRDAAYAAIRIDDGPQTPLTQEQKSAGQATISPNSDNVKIELMARHWMRDSHGIIRYVKAPAPAIQPAGAR